MLKYETLGNTKVVLIIEKQLNRNYNYNLTVLSTTYSL